MQTGASARTHRNDTSPNMSHPEKYAAFELLRTGTLVHFELVETDVRPPTADGEEYALRAELQLGEVDDDGDRSDDESWGAFGFIFALAVLSFHDARSRGYSEIEFENADEFDLKDFLDHLRYESGGLRFSADYVRGRCMKTDITVRNGGRTTLETLCRGEAATRWLDRLRGKKILKAV